MTTPLRYVGCNPLDKITDDPHTFWRLSFVPESILGGVTWWNFGNWTEAAQKQLDRVGQTPYFFPIQGAPTVVTDPEAGATFDVMARQTAVGVPLQTALSAVEDSYGSAILVQVEKHSNVTPASVKGLPAEQADSATAAADAASVPNPMDWTRTIATYGIVALILGLGIVVAWNVGRKA